MGITQVAGNSAKAALVVDAGKKTGRFRGLHRGFSGGFEALASTEGLKPYLGPIGATSLRAPVVREPGKGQPFFKGTTLADTQDPAMYDFRMIDQFVARIDALGLDILATLAEMPSSLSADGTGKGPPKDPKVFAEMVKHVVLHLTQGWADGHHYPILYWEIWNEPNLSKNPRVRQAYWTGTREQYLEMYAESGRRSPVFVKGHASHAPVRSLMERMCRPSGTQRNGTGPLALMECGLGTTNDRGPSPRGHSDRWTPWPERDAPFPMVLPHASRRPVPPPSVVRPPSLVPSFVVLIEGYHP